MIKKLVVSYSADDQKVANELRQNLLRAKYNVWIASDNLVGSVKWTQTLVDAIDDCDGLILLWSEAAKKSKDVNEEIRIARVFQKPIFPVLALPGTTVPRLPVEIDELEVITRNTFDLTIKDLIERLQDPERNTIRWNNRLDKGYIPKSYNSFFVGRKKELKQLYVDTCGFHGQSRKGMPIAISGLAGIGKTHLALTFGYRFNIFFPDGVYWIDTPNGIVQEFDKIGTHLRIKKLKDERPDEYATRVKDKLSQLKDALVIFDNVIDVQKFRRWCPEGSTSCATILTSRKSVRGFNVHVINLRELDSESAYELIISRREDGLVLSKDEIQRNALLEICEIMGNHPLGLEFCAKYLHSHIVKPVQFLNEIRKDVFTIEPHFQPSIGEGDATLLEILKLSYEKMNRELVDPYFLLMVWFPPHGINIDLLISAYSKTAEGSKALDELSDYNFIYFEREQNLVYIHPLVVQFGRAIQKSEKSTYQTLFSETILKFLNQNENDLTSDQVRKELPHILEAIEVTDKNELWDLCAQLRLFYANITGDIDISIEQLNVTIKIIEQHPEARTADLPGISIQLGKKYRAKAQFKKALAEFEKAQKYYDELQNTEILDQALLDFELGDTFLALGQYKKAEEILSHALNAVRNVEMLDDTSPEVCRIQQSLAKIDLFLGRFNEAEKKLNEVLGNRKRFHENAPGSETAEGIASCCNDLSQVSLGIGLYERAIEYAEEAFKIYKVDKSEDDPAFGYLHLQLSAIYYETVDYEKAIENIGKAQENFKKMYGVNHPSYARTLILFSNIQRKLSNFDEASKNIKQAIKIFKEQYPDENHPFMAQALEVQGKIYDHLCDFEKEEQTWVHLLAIQSKIYSEVHPAAATTHYDYGHLFLKKGNFENAIKHLELSMEIAKRSYGTTEHVLYFCGLTRLALCYYQRQDYIIAQEKLKEAGALTRKIFGENPHPCVARMLQLRSEVNRRLGNFKAALSDIDEAIKMKENIYKTEYHPSVAEALEIKVRIYHHTGEIGEAKKLIEQAFAIRIKHYGGSHPEVGKSEHDLGSLYLRLGDYKNAIQHFEKALNITESTFGEFYPDFIESSLHLANAYDEQGEYQKATEIVDSLENVIKKTIIDENHYLKARWLQQKAELLRRLGQFKDALLIIEKAIEMKKIIYNDPLHPSIADALEIQGKILDHLGEFEAEEKIWQKILAIQNKAYSNEHPDIAKTLNNYANLLMKQGKIEWAVGELQQSVGITKKIFGEEHIQYFGRLVLLAACYYEQQKYTSAIDILREAEGLRDKIFGCAPHPYIVRMFQLRSEVNRRLGCFEDALRNIDEAIEMNQYLYNPEHPSVAEALEVKVKIFHHTGEVVEAKKLIEHALNIRIMHFGRSHPEVGKSEHDLGSFYLRLGEYKNAIEHFEKALDITKFVFGEFHLDYIERSLHLANAYDEQGEYQKATEIVNNLEKIIEKVIEEDHYLKARWLQQKAELLRRLGKFEEALKIIEEAIKMKEKIYKNPLHPSVADALEIQGKIFYHLGELEKEENVWKRMLEIQDNAYPKDHPEIAETNYNYGNLYLRRGDIENAVKYLNMSVDITRKNFGTNHSQYFGRLIRLTTAYFQMQDYAITRNMLKHAKELRGKIFRDSPHPYIARMLQLQAEFAIQLGELDDASNFIEKSINMKENIYRPDHPSVADALEIKVDIKLIQYDTEESLKLLKRIESIRRQAYGKAHPEYSNYLMRLAQYYMTVDDYAQAEEKLNDSIQIWTEKFSANHIEMIKRRVMAAQIARISGSAVDAEKHINEAKMIVKETLKIEQSLLVSSIFSEESIIKRKLGDFAGSLDRIEQAIQIEEKILAANSPSLVELNINKIKLLIIEYRLSEADALLKSTHSKIPDIEEPIFQRLKARLLNQQGILDIYNFDYEQAVKTLDEAIKLNKAGQSSSVDLAKLNIDKAVALRELKRYEEALNCLDDAQNFNNPHFEEDHVYFARICLENGLNFYFKKSYFAAKHHLEDALKIYEIKMNQDQKERSQTLEGLGLINLETNFLDDAAQFFSEAMEIKKRIYQGGHPEFAITHFNEAQVSLRRLKPRDEDEEKNRSLAKQKLEKALSILKNHETNNEVLIEKIESCLTGLKDGKDN